MSTKTRYDFQQALNQFERNMMTDSANPGRVGVSIQINKTKPETQDEFAPTRGGNPYLSKGPLGMNCFCRLVIDDEERLKKCNALEVHLKRRIDEADETNKALCCRCHMGVSNFVYWHKTQIKKKDGKPTLMKNGQAAGGASEALLAVDNTEWYIFIGQFLCESNEASSGETAVADALPITVSRPSEKGAVLPYTAYKSGDEKLFSSDQTLASLVSAADKRLAELYKKASKDVQATDAPSIVKEDALKIFKNFVLTKFGEWVHAEAEKYGNLFKAGFKAFNDDHTTSHCAEELTDILAYLESWQVQTRRCDKQSGLINGMVDDVRNLKLSLEESKALSNAETSLAPEAETLERISVCNQDFKKPSRALWRWRESLFHAANTFANDFDKNEEIKFWAAKIKQPYRVSFFPLMTFARWLLRSQTLLGFLTLCLWMLCTGVFINLLTNLDGFKANPLHKYMMINAMLGATCGYFLTKGVLEWERSHIEFGRIGGRHNSYADLQRSFAVDLWISCSSIPRWLAPIFILSSLGALVCVLMFALQVKVESTKADPTTGDNPPKAMLIQPTLDTPSPTTQPQPERSR